jgi:DNA-binding transcriptional regulator GbsR (MarR family)
MDRAVTMFVDGIGTAAATSGILTQLEGRIFALLYLQGAPLALEDLAMELEQSKSNVSVNIRGLVDWHLVRRVRIAGSRKDHYEAATNLWRVMQEIMERRFRWNVRQVIATTAETKRVATELGRAARKAAERERAELLLSRLDTLLLFFSALDAAITAVNQGQPFTPETLQKLIPVAPLRAERGP